MDGKKLFDKRDLLLLSALLLLAAACFLLFSLAPKGAKAVVERNGEILLTRELSSITEPETLTVEGENGISLTVTLSPDGAEISSSSCPDQVCVRTGKLQKAGETALCLPARISLRLEGGSGADAATY